MSCNDSQQRPPCDSKPLVDLFEYTAVNRPPSELRHAEIEAEYRRPAGVRFSIRSLLVLTAVCATFFGIYRAEGIEPFARLSTGLFVFLAIACLLFGPIFAVALVARRIVGARRFDRVVGVAAAAFFLIGPALFLVAVLSAVLLQARHYAW